MRQILTPMEIRSSVKKLKTFCKALEKRSKGDEDAEMRQMYRGDARDIGQLIKAIQKKDLAMMNRRLDNMDTAARDEAWVRLSKLLQKKLNYE